ncbi:hypothetical protein HRJ34_14725 [Rhizorhabdus wittichii]|uniref:Uncharacterized protein n=1 Tax=Rhizorhabdus wittichii TaxID=160791 RepID=A0A975CYI2_9SPHN|nr:hypothetical protein [Rhizorhabdus wittichii]QTH19629.1 hypothetical protein HRJ34_14725 [Rhizorhabdus wittichii]
MMGIEVSPLIGDNRHSPADDARAAMLDVIRQRQPRIDEFVANLAQRTVMRDRIDAAAATDVIGLAQKVMAAIGEQRKAISSPYDAAAGAPIIVMRNALAPLDAEIARVLALIEAFDEAEKTRIADQRAEQAAEEQRLRDAARQAEAGQGRAEIVYAQGGPVPDPAPAAPAAGPAPIRGDYGFSYRKRAKIEVTVEDVTLIPPDILEEDIVQAAIAAAIKARATKNSRLTVAGATIHRGTRGSVN